MSTRESKWGGQQDCKDERSVCTTQRCESLGWLGRAGAVLYRRVAPPAPTADHRRHALTSGMRGGEEEGLREARSHSSG